MSMGLIGKDMGQLNSKGNNVCVHKYRPFYWTK